jgi:hypothetical protein
MLLLQMRLPRRDIQLLHQWFDTQRIKQRTVGKQRAQDPAAGIPKVRSDAKSGTATPNRSPRCRHSSRALSTCRASQN